MMKHIFTFLIFVTLPSKLLAQNLNNAIDGLNFDGGGYGSAPPWAFYITWIFAIFICYKLASSGENDDGPAVWIGLIGGTAATFIIFGLFVW